MIPVNGVIYKIILIEDDTCLYVGSTVNLEKRVNSHYSICYNSHSDGFTKPLYKHIRDNKIDFRNDCEFIVIKTVENTDKLEKEEFMKSLHIYEQKKIDKHQPLYNSFKAFRTEEEKKQYILEYHKTDSYKNYQKQYEKTDKHKQYLKQYNQTDKMKQWRKQYEQTEKRRQYNKERTKKRNSIQHTCEKCGGSYVNSVRARHLKTKKHLSATNIADA